MAHNVPPPYRRQNKKAQIISDVISNIPHLQWFTTSSAAVTALPL
jgi:hypothetical protein